ncbi:unnamed protein product, partial [Iphiclides podalirius]
MNSTPNLLPARILGAQSTLFIHLPGEGPSYIMPTSAKQTSRKTKKFQRLKSPWKKKRHFTSDTERCALRETRSYKFILRPEDVSRAGSQCCQKSSCSKRSDATFVTSQIAYTTKMKEKSHSAIYDRFHAMYFLTQDFKEISFAEAKVMKDAIVSEEEHKITAERKRHTKVTVSCQCSVEDILKNICQCREIAPNFIPEKVECVQGDSYAKCCQCQKQQQQNLVASQKMDESNGNTSKYSSNLLKETVVQTSDHSITFLPDELDAMAEDDWLEELDEKDDESAMLGILHLLQKYARSPL